MSRHAGHVLPGVEATAREIDGQAAAEQHEREATERAAAREAEHAREDRDAQQARARALFSARPEVRGDLAALLEVDQAERERSRERT